MIYIHNLPQIFLSCQTFFSTFPQVFRTSFFLTKKKASGSRIWLSPCFINFFVFYVFTGCIFPTPYVFKFTRITQTQNTTNKKRLHLQSFYYLNIVEIKHTTSIIGSTTVKSILPTLSACCWVDFRAFAF